MMKDIYNNFDACLHIDDAEITGNASVSVAKDEVIFVSEFVPIYPPGTIASIDRIYNGRAVHNFCGEVYLSDKKVMKIVAVTDELLEGSQECYKENILINAKISNKAKPETPKKPRSKKAIERVKEESKLQEIEINSLTKTQLSFSFKYKTCQLKEKGFGKKVASVAIDDKVGIKVDDKMYIHIGNDEEIPTKTIKVNVTETLILGQNPIYSCKIIDMQSSEREMLKKYLEQYNLENNKCF